MNPAKIHLISEIPEPAAYFAKDRTRRAAINENVPYGPQNRRSTRVGFGRGSETYGKNGIDHPSGDDIVTPIVPGVTGLVFRFDFPTTELLV